MSLTRSRPKVGIGYHGAIPKRVLEVVALAFGPGIAVSSDFARTYSTEVSLAASLGWISTVSLDGLSYGRTWNATLEGVNALSQNR